jgi:hypothetical protein
MPVYKTRLVVSPFRKPLARYLSKHGQYTVSFFFQRLKTPIYSELFHSLLQEPESAPLREYLCSKQCLVMILNACFEKPLAIIRSEKSSTASGSPAPSLLVHGITPLTSAVSDSVAGLGTVKPMSIEALELQFQGLRLISTLMSYDVRYFREHNDIIRAFRWLWRSKGRFLRLQHEDGIAPRYHSESKMLSLFLMSYS